MSIIINNIKKYKYLYLLLLPALIFYIIFCYGPMYGIQIAFKNYMFNKGIWGSSFVGFKYFRMVLMNRNFGELSVIQLSLAFHELFFVSRTDYTFSYDQ